jgi:hypothetical protein
MPERRLLYLTQHQVIAFHWRNGTLTPDGEFAAETSADDFTRYLGEHPGSLFSLVVNLGEEGFQNDVIPYLQAKDRKAVIARRLGQNFQGAPLAIALSHGYESGARKNERLLLTALTSLGQLSPWLNAMQAVGSRLQGIHTLPLLSEGLLQRLDIKITRGILITIQDNSIRQSFFNNGRLAFSRVAPLIGSSIRDIALGIAGEANRFQQYLLSQRMVGRSDRLAAHVIVHPQALPAIQAARFNEGIDITAHDILVAAKKLGLKTAPTDSRAQALFLHCAIAAPPTQQFATAELRQPYRLWQLGNAMRAGGALIFAACLLFSFKLLVDSQRAGSEAVRQTREAEGMEQNYKLALGSLPPIPMSNEVLRQLVERFEQLRKSTDSPAQALRDLSLALDASPPVEISHLDWLAPGAKTSDSGAGNSPARQGNAPANSETLLVKGNLHLGAKETPRRLLASLDEFAERLRQARPGTRVTVLQNPVDLNAGRALKSADGAPGGGATRQFSLQIEYPVQP